MEQNTLIKKNFDSAQLELISKLLTSLSNDQKIWLGGYLSGINESTNTLLQLISHDKSLTGLVQSSQELPLLKILYGTRSGNAQKVAQKAQKKAHSLGLNTQMVNLNDYNPKDIKREKFVLVVVSTDGEGEPPVSAEEFYNYLHSKKAPKLNELEYSVLALGDSSYQQFCKTRKDIDQRLKELGAKPFADRVDCDLDFDEPASEWVNASIEKFAKENKAVSPQVQFGTNGDSNLDVQQYTQENPYNSPLLDKILLNGRGTSKETFHYEFSIEDSGITYTPGDSLGVYSTNDQKLVDRILELTKINESDRIVVGKEEKTIREALTHNYELTRLTPPLLKSYAALAKSAKLDKIIADAKSFEEYQWGRDVIDLIEEYPVPLDNKTLFSTLRKLQPRLYSIASSYNANPDEVHTTIATVKYNTNNRDHFGVCSTFLSNRIDEDAEIPIYIDENIGFRLPSDPTSRIIMIGPGTGVAPFRAFMQERSLSDNAGKSWLFFGDRNFRTDFLYQTEWQKYKKKGQLTNIDLAFSRDQKEKIYVQHKILQHKKELFQWLQEGAHVYVCGDKNAMAKDVKAALIKVIESEGGFKTNKAEEYFKQLRKENRFQEDVY